MLYQAHKGVESEYPENTLPSFTAAASEGYEYIELDPNFTADGVCVVMHDPTINRTCRNADGSKAEKEVPVRSITYSELLKYDAGIAKAYKFRGTKVPTLAETLAVAKQHGMTAKIDNKMQAFSEQELEILFDVIENSSARVGFTCTDTEFIKKVVSRFPHAEIHYDGYVDEDKLKEISALLKSNPLVTWLALDTPHTWWVSVPKADKALAAVCKKYGKLGIWIIYTPEQLAAAEELSADIIETHGQVKPKKVLCGAVDCHTHSEFSHDSVCHSADMMQSATEKGIVKIAVTDHCDISFNKETDVKTPIMHSVETAAALGDGALKGVEIGEAIWFKDIAEDIASAKEYDIILGSVHFARAVPELPYSQINFGEFDDEKITAYLSSYFEDMLEMIKSTDFDVLSHLTCPLRYICGKYGKKVDLTKFDDVIKTILQEIIERGIALEINTSCLESAYDELLPNDRIIKRYLELGGYLLTLGSDAHTANRAAHCFEKAIAALKGLGVKNAFYYKNRTPVQYSLEEL